MTSGPWELVITDYVLLIVANKQRDLVFELGMPLRDEAGIASEATIANALLIAAAPDLLAVVEAAQPLIAALTLLALAGTRKEAQQLLTLINAVLRKVNGEDNT